MFKSRHDQRCLDNLDDIMSASASSVIKIEEDTAFTWQQQRSYYHCVGDHVTVVLRQPIDHRGKAKNGSTICFVSSKSIVVDFKLPQYGNRDTTWYMAGRAKSGLLSFTSRRYTWTRETNKYTGIFVLVSMKIYENGWYLPRLDNTLIDQFTASWTRYPIFKYNVAYFQ